MSKKSIIGIRSLLILLLMIFLVVSCDEEDKEEVTLEDVQSLL